MTRPGVLRLLLLASSIAGCAGATEPEDGSGAPPPDPATVVAVSVRTVERTPISPYIYGSNQDDASDVWTVRRFGRNRITGYNWETNDSNAGSDYLHNSDLFAIANAGIPIGEASVPARALTWFHDQSLAMGAENDRYTSAAFKLFRDYDGQHGAFGGTGVATASTDPARASTYGAIEGADAAKLHLILLNKDAADTLTFRIQIESDVQYATGAAWGFDARSSQITSRTGVARIQGNRFDYSIAPLTAIHLVLR